MTTSDERQRVLVKTIKLLREFLPGDSRFGDPLSTAGGEQSHLIGRRLTELTADRPSLLREAGFSALQVWQAIAGGERPRRSDAEIAIAFTDLVEFSRWALEAGDGAALELLRDVGQAIEPPVKTRNGDVVKWLGDGMMAVFEHPQDAFDAIIEGRERLAAVERPGYEPRIRAGIHVGRPRRIGGDYLGVDVNVAARVAEGASPGEVLASDRAVELLDTTTLRVRRKRLFRGKGVPSEVTVYSVRPKG
jgi:class 3 adenylate cyclase